METCLITIDSLSVNKSVKALADDQIFLGTRSLN